MGVLGKNYLHTVATNVILKLVFGLVIGIVTARALGPEGRGEYNLLVLIITTLTTLLNFGIPGSNTYFLASNRLGLEKLMRGSFLLAIGASLVSLLLLYASYRTGLLAHLFPIEKLTPTILSSLVIIPVAFFNLFAQGIIIGENKIFLNNYLYLGSQGMLASTLLLSYVFGMLTVPLAVILFSVSNFVTFTMIIVAYRSTIFTRYKVGMTWTDYKNLLRFSLPLQAGVILQFLNYRLDAFLVNAFLGTFSVGIYVLAVNLVEIPWLLSASMASVLFPTVASNHQQSKKILAKAATATFAVTLVGGILAFFLAPYFIVVLFSEKFAASVLPFQILLPGIVIFSITNVLASYMAGVGKPGFNTLIALVALVFTIVLDITLIPRIGIPGAAIASSFSYCVSTLFSLILFVRISKLSGREFLDYIISFRNDFRSINARIRTKILAIMPQNLSGKS